MPDLPYCLNVRRLGITGRFISAHVVAEADGIDQLAGVLVVLRIEGVDVADAAAHEQEDDRLGLGLEVRPQVSARESSVRLPTSRPGRAPKKPPPAWCRKPRRVIRPQG